jgi:hypothetical protein
MTWLYRIFWTECYRRFPPNILMLYRLDLWLFLLCSQLLDSEVRKPKLQNFRVSGLKNSSIFWDITLYLPHASPRYLACLVLRAWRRTRHDPPKRRLTLNEVQGRYIQEDRILQKWSCPCAYTIKHNAMMTYGKVELVLDLGTWWRWVVRFTPLPLYPQGKHLDYGGMILVLIWK